MWKEFFRKGYTIEQLIKFKDKTFILSPFVMLASFSHMCIICEFLDRIRIYYEYDNVFQQGGL
jgi:hypothetical protein